MIREHETTQQSQAERRLPDLGPADEPWIPATAPASGRQAKGDNVKTRTFLVLGVLGLIAALAGCSFFGDQGPDPMHWEPAVSPDGAFLVYESTVEGQLELFLLDLGSSQETRLTSNEDPDWSPTWSPDGQRIAFTSYRDKNADLYILEIDSMTVTRLTSDSADDVYPDWGPDNRIYFNSNRSDVWEAYSINPDGSDLIKLTQVGD